MEKENKNNPQELQNTETWQSVDIDDPQVATEVAPEETGDSLEQSVDILESQVEKESVFVRTKMGRLALKIATDPIFNIGVAGFALNTAVNNMTTPTVLNTAMAVASTAAATWRAIDISNGHLSELEQAELKAQQN